MYSKECSWIDNRQNASTMLIDQQCFCDAINDKTFSNYQWEVMYVK